MTQLNCYYDQFVSRSRHSLDITGKYGEIYEIISSASSCSGYSIPSLGCLTYKSSSYDSFIICLENCNHYISPTMA